MKKTKAISRILAYEGIALIAFGLLTFIFASDTYLFGVALFLTGLICIVGFLVLGGVSLKDRIFSRGAKYGTNAIVYSVVILGILTAVNYVGANHNKEWDLTSIKANTLSDQTTKVLQSLTEKTKAYAFFKAGEDIAIDNLLERYARVCELFDFEIVDPDLHPEIVKRFEITERGQIAIEHGARTTITVGQTEQDITNAIIKVSKEQQGALYFLEGHGEAPLEGQSERGLYAIKLGLENENYVVKKLLLESQPEVPSDCKALIVAGPTKTLPKEVVDKIYHYLEGGGRALLMIDPQTISGLENLTASYGATLENNVIIDQQVRLFEGATLGLDPIVQDFPPHEITKNFEQAVVFPQTRSVTLDNATPEVSINPLGKTSESSWAETDISLLFESGQVTLDPEDKPGPVVVAAAIVKKLEPEAESAPENPMTVKKEARLVIVGDSDFATNQYINFLFNGPLVLNMVHWLSGENFLTAIPPRSYAPSMVQLTPKDKQLVFIASVFLVPQIILMLGIGTILRRRGR